MKKLLIILLCFTALNATAQSWKIDWKKTSINIGSALLSVGLEMTGDALYDMGKASGNTSQMQWGHVLQATGYVVPLITIPILVKDSNNKLISDIAIIVGTYGLTRFATADAFYNATAGRPLLDVGSVTAYDKFMSKMPPDGRFSYKLVSFTFGIAININHWR